MNQTGRIHLGAVSLAAGLIATAAPAAGAQDHEALVREERRALTAWLQTGATSPYAVLAQRPIGPGVTLGPSSADIPLPGLPLHRISVRNGSGMIESGGQSRPLPRHRPIPLGDHRVSVTGPAGRTVLMVYAPAPRNPKAPTWYPYDRRFALTVTLRPPASPERRRLLAADGLEVTATDAGTVEVTLQGETTRLQVYRIPDQTGEESDLEVYFRDETNGRGTYPAGRFVTLEPLGGSRYRLDFNRARNPFCAYSTVFACPLPWRGNALPSALEGGEKYTGGGLELPGAPDPVEVR